MKDKNIKHYGSPEHIEFWKRPLPEKEGGLFDYDKFFVDAGLVGRYSDFELVHHIPVHKIRLGKRA